MAGAQGGVGRILRDDRGDRLRSHPEGHVHQDARQLLGTGHQVKHQELAAKPDMNMWVKNKDFN